MLMQSFDLGQPPGDVHVLQADRGLNTVTLGLLAGLLASGSLLSTSSPTLTP